MVILLLSASGTLVISVVSDSFVPDLKTYLGMTDCSIYMAIDTAMNGDTNWGGFTNLRDKVGNITNLLSAAVTQIQIYFPGDSWLVTSMQAMQTANLNFYEKYKNSQMVTPNPDTTATNLNANISVPMIDSRFIRQGLGPNGTENTMVSDIDSALRATEKVHPSERSCPNKPTRSRSQPPSSSTPSTRSSTTPWPARIPFSCITASSISH